VIFDELERLRRRVRAATRNALEIARVGRLSTTDATEYEIVDRGKDYKLRRYRTTALPGAPVAVLIPPLMVTAEIYDVAPDISAVAALGVRGVVPYVVDFGAPEREAGGLERTLDDHVRAVLAAIAHVRRIEEGRPVHLLGYSQGGMFAYQAAAYLRGAGLGSIITFGSPVDIHRNLPAVRSDVTGALVEYIEPALRPIFERLTALPGALTSTGFKIVSGRKEIEQRVDFLRMLHDRNALERSEARRRFLGGEGFVAWPGPAFRAFVSDFIVHNRMLSGGFVINGRTVTLADLACPILAFVGTSDEIARPDAVRAITTAAPEAKVTFFPIRAGHFGLVVGSRAMSTTWPTVSDWLHYQNGTGPKPRFLATKDAPEPEDEADFDVELELLFGALRRTTANAWRRLGDVAASASDTVDALRWQEPRLRRLANLSDDDAIGPAAALRDAAATQPDATFFLWRGRAFTYRDADERVTNVAKGLWASGVRPADRVLVVMGSRPSFLTVVTAVARLGAVPVVAPPTAAPAALRASADAESAKYVVADPEHGARLVGTFDGVLVLGGGGGARELPAGLVDMEAIDVASIHVPVELDAAKARDLAMILLRPTADANLRAAHVTGRRWALSALGAAAACTLKPADTVYCPIPLHHPTGILASVGAALLGGCRLALGEGFDPTTFTKEVRRVGATVVFYAGEMLRPLLAAPPGPGDRTLPVRLFAGSGMRAQLAESIEARFGVGTLEFYASTSLRVVFANAVGKKPGALGRPLPGSALVELVRCDLAARAPIRDAHGQLVEAEVGEEGVLRIQGDDGREMTGTDVLRRDEDGDYWLVDALAGFVSTERGIVPLRPIEDAMYALPGVQLAVAWVEGGKVRAAITGGEAHTLRFRDALDAIPRAQRPDELFIVESIPLTDGYRTDRNAGPRLVVRERLLGPAP
jgi:putative long chain acyl-CoA synthase